MSSDIVEVVQDIVAANYDAGSDYIAQQVVKAIQETHAIVPREPTEAMVQAGENDGGHSYYRWQAMIAASDAP